MYDDVTFINGPVKAYKAGKSPVMKAKPIDKRGAIIKIETPLNERKIKTIIEKINDNTPNN